MRRILDPRLLALFVPIAAIAATPALADDFYVGSSFGSILRADAEEGQFRSAGVCGGPIRSMLLVGQTIMIGDRTGRVYGLNTDGGGVSYYFSLPNSDNTAIVADDGALIISNLAGSVRRVNPNNGQVLATYTSPVQIQAMIRDDQYLYVGGPEGSVYRASIDSGEFSYFACVCLGPINSLAIVGEELLAGDEWGSVMRFNLTDGIPVSAFRLPGDNTSMAVTPSGELYITDSDGNVRNVDPITGDVLRTMDANAPIEAIVFVGEEQCAADFNRDGSVTSGDFFEFVNVFLAGKRNADFNNDGRVASDDFFGFVTAFFTPCI